VTTVTARARRALAGTGAVALALILLVASAGAPAARAADDDFVAGSGSAIASAIQVGPAAGGLSLRWTFAKSLAGYIGTVGQAEAQRLDIGLWGLLLTAKQCDGGPGPLTQDQVPLALRADSREDGAAAGRVRQQAGTDAASPVQVNEGLEQVRATPDPHAYSTATMAAASIPGVLDVRAAKSNTDSGIVKGSTRVSLATVDLGDVDLLGGLIKLRGLRWTARHQTGTDKASEGTFTLQGAEIGGQSLPTNDAAAAIAAVNQITSQVGLALAAPRVTEDNGVLQVSPLLVRLQASPTESSVFTPALVNLQPARKAVVQAINALTCRVQTIVTVADVSIGPLTGAGAFDFALGGTSATTEGTRFENPFAAFPSGAGGGLTAGAAVLAAQASASVPGGASIPGTSGTPALGGQPPRNRTGAVRTGTGVLAGARSLAGKTGGWPVLVGFIAVAGVLSVAGADWLRVRRASTGGDT
jgi:hypothetical protein